MIAVIFKAELGKPDDEYYRFAKRLRDLAKSEYGCIDLISVCENGTELTISYWNSLIDIELWKSDPEHRYAQSQGIAKWYRSYSVELAEVLE